MSTNMCDAFIIPRMFYFKPLFQNLTTCIQKGETFGRTDWELVINSSQSKTGLIQIFIRFDDVILENTLYIVQLHSQACLTIY